MLFSCVNTEEIKMKMTPYLEATVGLRDCCRSGSHFLWSCVAVFSLGWNL